MTSIKLAIAQLILLIVLCFGMVTLGGYVRLSGSGLSIPEWPFFTIRMEQLADGTLMPVRSIFPPTTADGWQTLHATYVTYLMEHHGIEDELAMSEFKRMFWTEWSHRGLAKFIGVVFLAFMGTALISKTLRPRIGALAVGSLLLLVLQAVMGGIVVKFHLASVKVSIHLTLAFFFTSLLVWMLLLLVHPPAEQSLRRPGNPVMRWGLVLFGVVSAQIFSGGLMAASHAGYQINTWPLMGEYLVPNGLWPSGMGAFETFTEHILMIQFFHRWFAFAVALGVIFFVMRTLTIVVSPTARWALRLMFATVTLQIILGILTLLGGVQPHMALTHQSFGLVLLLNVLIVVYEAWAQPVYTEADQMAGAEQAVAPSRTQARGTAAHVS